MEPIFSGMSFRNFLRLMGEGAGNLQGGWRYHRKRSKRH